MCPLLWPLRKKVALTPCSARISSIWGGVDVRTIVESERDCAWSGTVGDDGPDG